jgi:hypothetical protein
LAQGRRLPDISPRNRKYRLLLETWKRLPVKIAGVLGPAIVKYIP